MIDLKGKIINGRYKIEDVVGVGGMSVVYRAYDLAENIRVAVKVLKEEFLVDPQFRRRFETESKIISMLNHDNIVTIHNVGFNDDLYYIVMEYIEGITLKEYIEQEGRLSWEDALTFTVQVLCALEHAHSRGVVHRDIKPQNIMLLSDGTIKVTDFGIAKLTNVQTFTMTEKAIGSVHYISPEQVTGGTVDERSDIYSVGIMLYEMLTGRVPFDNENPVSVAVMQLQNNAVRPRALVPGIPEGLDDIVMKAISKAPDDRFQSAGEFLADINRLRENPTVRFQQRFVVSDATRPIDSEGINLKQEENITGVKKKRKKRLPKPAAVAIAAVITAFLVFGITLLAINVSGGRSDNGDVQVPDLLGLVYEDIADSEEYADFRIIEAGREASDEYDEGEICRQDPEDGKTVKKGSDIRVYVSTGIDSISVPDVVGSEYREALIALSNEGLSGRKEEEASDTVAAGFVIRTDPEAGEEVAKNTKITIYVSSGAEVKSVEMPSVIGDSKNDAAVKLGELGLVVTYTEVSSSQAAETVVGQSIASGTQVETGTTVTLSISAGSSSSGDGGNSSDDGSSSGNGGASQLKKKQITVSLPDYESSYTVVVMQNGTQVYSKVHSPGEVTLKLELQGTGTQDVQVKIAELDLMIFTGTVNFD